jgi:hypothetical protein
MKKTEDAEKPKRAKKPAELTPELLASRIEASPEGAEAVKLLVQAAMTGRQDLMGAALRKLMAAALTDQPRKRGKAKAEPVAPQEVAPKTQAQIEAEEARIPASQLIRNLTQPAPAGEVLASFIQAQLLPSYRTGQRVWQLKPTWKGRPLTSIRETWQQQLQAAGMDTSRLLLQVSQGFLVVNLNGFALRG